MQQVVKRKTHSSLKSLGSQQQQNASKKIPKNTQTINNKTQYGQMTSSISNQILNSFDHSRQRTVQSGKRPQGAGHVKNNNTSLYKPTQMVHAAPTGSQNEMFTLMMNNTQSQSNFLGKQNYQMGQLNNLKSNPSKSTTQSRNQLNSFDPVKNTKKKGRQTSTLANQVNNSYYQVQGQNLSSLATYQADYNQNSHLVPQANQSFRSVKELKMSPFKPSTSKTQG